MASQRNTGAFIAGSVIGGILGSAVVLWKTPKSGAELRGGLSGDRHGAIMYRAGDDGNVTEGRRFSNPVLGFVERAAAPIVGVELGKLARDDPQVMTAAPVRTSSADAKPPVQPVAGVAPGSPVSEAQDPSEEATHDAVEGSSAHAASSEELTSPTPEYAEQLAEAADVTDTPTGDASFPDAPRRDSSH